MQCNFGKPMGDDGKIAETLSIVLSTELYTPMTLARSECGSAYMQGHSADYLYRQIRTEGTKRLNWEIGDCSNHPSSRGQELCLLVTAKMVRK
jgi:hypothetical protein